MHTPSQICSYSNLSLVIVRIRYVEQNAIKICKRQLEKNVMLNIIILSGMSLQVSAGLPGSPVITNIIQTSQLNKL